MKVDSTPLITVLMPCYNAEKYLDVAIESIVSQTYQNLHILLLNDGSTDSTLEICQQWSQKDTRIEIIQNEQNLGLIKTLNKGILLSSSPYIARMDADDRSALNRIQKQVEFLLQNEEIGIVGTTSLPIDLEGKLINEKESLTYLHPETLSFSCFFTQPFFHGSILGKTQILKKNLYSEAYKHSEDFELWLRLNSKGVKFKNLTSTIYYYRINPEGVSKSNEKTQIESHNKASLFYLKKVTEFPIDEEIVGLLNNRPIQKVSYRKLKEAISFFKTFRLAQNSGKELRTYCTRQKIDICIQSFKKSKQRKDKLLILSFLLFNCMNGIALKYLLKKMN